MGASHIIPWLFRPPTLVGATVTAAGEEGEEPAGTTAPDKAITYFEPARTREELVTTEIGSSVPMSIVVSLSGAFNSVIDVQVAMV
ncbi:hypothetical protein TrRE_jg13469 [Triparma retinervis]|uniref:Uncharacterized protein n=1 Tax=Triparma retinervis TaxID=2557542 RepID=A0A9W7FAZ3_9STRA|nr:hypothetical protein TrRE_jg13469 [Triparma retinervis]